MPVFEITAPDGRTFEVEGPEGATQEEALAQVQAQYQPQERQPHKIQGNVRQPRQYFRETVRQVGRAGRNIAQGALALPAMVGDAPFVASNALNDLVTRATGSGIPGHSNYLPFSGALQALDDPLLADKTAAERYESSGTRALSGAAMGMGIGGALAGTAGAATQSGGYIPGMPGAYANPAAQQVGATLANPALQTSSNLSGAMSAQTAQELGGGPLVQSLAGMAGGVMPGIATGIARGITPTREAQRMLDEGVDLTPGQLNPEGKLAQIESGSQRIPILGPEIRKAREGALSQWRDSFVKNTAPKGAKIQAKGDVNAVLDEVYDAFGPAYDQAKGVKVIPAIKTQGRGQPLKAAFNAAVRDPSIRASDASRSSVGKWLQNQLTKPISTSDDLLNIRSSIRSEMRKIKGSTTDDMMERELLKNAENAVTASLNSQLPAKALKALRETDAQYAKYKVAEDAVYRGGDKGFTPFQAGQAVKSSSDKGAYARGGGLMRDSSSAAAKTFADVNPQTGASLLAIAAGVPLGTLLSPLTLTRTGRRLAAGQYPWQQQLPQQNVAPLGNLLAQPWAE